jgi:hypothetical protein
VPLHAREPKYITTLEHAHVRALIRDIIDETIQRKTCTTGENTSSSKQPLS